MKKCMVIAVLAILNLFASTKICAQPEYKARKAAEYTREAEYYQKKADGYRREAEYYQKKAEGYEREAAYYTKKGDATMLPAKADMRKAQWITTTPRCAMQSQHGTITELR